MSNRFIFCAQICFAVLMLLGCNTSQIDEAVEQNDNPEVADLVNNDDQKNADASDGRLEVSEDAAAKISTVEGVEDAWVFVTNQDAFVAIELLNSEGEEVPQEIKNEVISEIEASDLKDIENIYISSSPEMRDTFAAYVKRIKDGDSVEKLADEFRGDVERMIPDVISYEE
ncbi:YhcN/YlaJ family sporulation lipoprotein [Jeotgalibacillus campisalis]|uniref:Lipoprotein n=1 Tax=Jeotgalibacillus campisalis TaxID=220754 RepID=A0A0C2R9U4_9BACL|nr:YhcN/YlaJ family sporulation lipoprotein [Jeotgalibacillus campisalis]KIL47065.1 hypothetical protein KR50_23870 [Jeotgalibacillus campisalis]